MTAHEVPEPDTVEPDGVGPDVVRGVLAGGAGTPDAPAIVAGRRVLTHGELACRAGALAARLRREGLVPGDAMLFSVRPGPDAVVLALALLSGGGVVVVADPGAGPEVFAARAALSRPRWAAAESVLYALSAPGPWRGAARRRGLVLPDYGSLGIRLLRAGPWLPGVPRGTGSLAAWCRGGPGPLPGAEADDPDRLRAPALVVFTSGTTGDPRAVVHSRRSLGAALATSREVLRVGPGDRVVTDQLMIGLPALAAGACWVVPRIGAPPADLVRRIRENAGTHAFTTPVGWGGVLALPEVARDGLPASLHNVLTGGAPAPAPLLGRLAAAAPQARVAAIYGATEMLPAAVVDATEKTAFTGPGDLVGRPLPGVEVRIDPERHEVLLRGPHLAEGYLRSGRVQPLPTLATGDAGRLEPGPDGDRLVLEGRLKEMMIRGSMNIYPGLYEPGVLAVPGVRDCALVGLPDPLTADERIVLAVVTDPGDGGEAVLARVRAALPEVFDAAALPDDVLPVEALPRSGRSRKLDRTDAVAQVRELLAARRA